MAILKNIIDNSGDSILEKYTYSEGILTINLYLTDLERKVEIKIKTDILSFNNYYLEKREELYRTCRIEIQDLLNVLSIESKSNIYIPSSTFGKLMNETRLNYSLAYGKKSSELKYIFSLVGYGRLLSCLLTDLDCIAIDI